MKILFIGNSHTYDFTLPDSDWIPVKENVDDEIVEIPLEVARVIRECVENN